MRYARRTCASHMTECEWPTDQGIVDRAGDLESHIFRQPLLHDTELFLFWRVLLFLSWPINWFDSWIWTHNFHFHSTSFLSWLRALWSASQLFLGFVLWWEFCLQVWSDNNSAIMSSSCQVKIGFMFSTFVESPSHSWCFDVEILLSGFHLSAQHCHLEAW